MSLFDLSPITVEQVRAGLQGSTTLKDKKGRAKRRRPYWIDEGKGPEGAICRQCIHLKKMRYTKIYYKCGKQPITHGPGTDISPNDLACRWMEAITTPVS